MPVPAPVPSTPISGSNGPWLSELEIEAQRAEAKRKSAAQPWSSYLSDDNIRYYAGPHLWRALQKMKTAATSLGAAADLNDAASNYRAMGESFKSGDLPGAVRDFGYGLLSNIGLSEVSQPSKAIFAGVMAKTANYAKLQKAHKLARSGANDLTIWNETGWSRGADGRWRFEIDDSQMRVKPEVWAEINKPASGQWRGRAGELIDHPEFFKAYPEVANLDALVRRRGAKDDGLQGYLGFRPPMAEPQLRMEKYGAGHEQYDPKKLKEMLLHEFQHAVQWREGFAPGGSFGSRGALEEYLRTDIARQQTLASDLENTLRATPLATKKAASLQQRLYEANEAVRSNQEKLNRIDMLADDELYWRLAGEVEARSVQARSNLTPADRRSAPPSSSEDVSRARQFVLSPLPR